MVVTDTLPEVVSGSVFSLLYLGRHLLPLTTYSRYQPRDSNGNLFLTTTSRSISMSDMDLDLDFVSIH